MCNHTARDRNRGRDRNLWTLGDKRLKARLRPLSRFQFILLFESELTRFALARVMLLPEVLQPTHPQLDILLTHWTSYLTITDDQIISNAVLDSLRGGPGKRTPYTSRAS